MSVILVAAGLLGYALWPGGGSSPVDPPPKPPRRELSTTSSPPGSEPTNPASEAIGNLVDALLKFHKEQGFDEALRRHGISPLGRRITFLEDHPERASQEAWFRRFNAECWRSAESFSLFLVKLRQLSVDDRRIIARYLSTAGASEFDPNRFYATRDADAWAREYLREPDGPLKWALLEALTYQANVRWNAGEVRPQDYPLGPETLRALMDEFPRLPAIDRSSLIAMTRLYAARDFSVRSFLSELGTGPTAEPHERRLALEVLASGHPAPETVALLRTLADSGDADIREHAVIQLSSMTAGPADGAAVAALEACARGSTHEAVRKAAWVGLAAADHPETPAWVAAALRDPELAGAVLREVEEVTLMSGHPYRTCSIELRDALRDWLSHSFAAAGTARATAARSLFALLAVDLARDPVGSLLDAKATYAELRDDPSADVRQVAIDAARLARERLNVRLDE